MDEVAFGNMLKMAIRIAATLEERSVVKIEEDIEKEIFYVPTTIRRWKKGHLPDAENRQETVEKLARFIIERTNFNRAWLETFLQSAGYFGIDDLCSKIFPQPQPIIEESSEMFYENGEQNMSSNKFNIGSITQNQHGKGTMVGVAENVVIHNSGGKSLADLLESAQKNLEAMAFKELEQDCRAILEQDQTLYKVYVWLAIALTKSDIADLADSVAIQVESHLARAIGLSPQDDFVMLLNGLFKRDYYQTYKRNGTRSMSEPTMDESFRVWKQKVRLLDQEEIELIDALGISEKARTEFGVTQQ